MPNFSGEQVSGEQVLSRPRRSLWLDSIFQKTSQGLAIAILLLVAAIVIQLAIAAIPAAKEFGLGFLWTMEWNPVKNIYGILPQIYGTLVSSLVAIALAMPLGIGIAIFLNEDIAPKVVRVPISFAIELLAAIPSVVYGLWGIFVLMPALRPLMRGLHQNLGWIPFFSTLPANRSLLPTILVLTLMILPIVVALSRDAIASVPMDLRLGAAAIGANRWEFILGIAIPASMSGIVGAAVLALGRAIGETMAAVMLIGNANQINWSWLAPSSTIASLVANQFTEAKGLQLSALLYAALVLMALTLIVNIFANSFITSFHSSHHEENLDPLIAQVTNDPPQSPLERAKKKILPPFQEGLGGIYTSKSSSSHHEENLDPLIAQVTNDPPQSPLKRGKKKILPPFQGGLGGIYTSKRSQRDLCIQDSSEGGELENIAKDRAEDKWKPNQTRRKIVSFLLNLGICLGTAIAIFAFSSILFSLIAKGSSRFDFAAFTELPPAPLESGGGFRNAITGTLLMVGIGAGLSAPIGIGAAIYLVEFGQNKLLSQWVRFFNGVLSGVPSIICGLFAYGLVVLTSGTFSAIAGGVALAVVMLPTIARTSEEALKAVAPELREGAIAIGASPIQAITAIVIPAAMPAIVTGIVLAIARATGETAPLLFTALFSQYGLNGLWKPVASMSVLIYNFALSPYPNDQALAWTAALVVVALILSISIAARFLTRDRLN
ncbi:MULTISPECIES: phosphate ABC transporter permease PstA [Pseudanabaena]|uniref:phosphate ABC transporter permease PstA n=1 Tax=Pseudanabaena TaxID=1152 RepID=UPI002479B439|nr:MULTISPECIES: phosphate ABC transporter permease PstA [Pseudanabaena]WGS72676.1 phosphate ABC transporter permease PstA [Pseudanabaena galeata CCNP1313]